MPHFFIYFRIQFFGGKLFTIKLIYKLIRFNFIFKLIFKRDFVNLQDFTASPQAYSN